jgi:hypothetical protein
MNRHPRIDLEVLMRDWKPYKSPCSCCDHDGEMDDSSSGERTNELFGMVRKVADCLTRLEEENRQLVAELEDICKRINGIE